eukprot:GEMP01111456.1.p1 GENE.GEMP01111456.1~~GEMP01111456.1.p1  ORF type:complete len:111 (-),score=2.45 GEMP01111456.1:150-482(-)
MGSHAQNIAKKDDVNILVEDVCHFFVFSRISAVNLFFCLRCAFFWVFLVRPPYFLNGFSMLGICILFFLSRPLYLFLYRHMFFVVIWGQIGIDRRHTNLRGKPKKIKTHD